MTKDNQIVLSVRSIFNFRAMMLFSISLHLLVAAVISYAPKQRGGGIPFANLEMLLQSESSGNELSESPPLESKTDMPESTPPIEEPSAYESLKNNLKDAVATANQNPDAMNHSSIGLGLTNGYFSGLGEGETLREDIKEYYLHLLREVNGKWWLASTNYSAPAKTIIVNMLIARNGEIIGVKMLQGSGSRSDDSALLKSLEKASPLPPLPKSYDGEVFVAPLRFNAPLNLLSPMKLG